MNGDAIKTIDDLIGALGGTADAADALGATHGQVRIWKVRGYIPPEHFTRHQVALVDRGIAAPPEIWKQVSARLPAPVGVTT